MQMGLWVPLTLVLTDMNVILNIFPLQVQFFFYHLQRSAILRFENGVHLCSGCSPLWSPLSWRLPSRSESHTGWQGWPAAGWLVAWSWWYHWPPMLSSPEGKKNVVRAGRTQRKERVPEEEIRQLELRWKLNHCRVLTLVLNSLWIWLQLILLVNLFHMNPNILKISVLSSPYSFSALAECFWMLERKESLLHYAMSWWAKSVHHCSLASPQNPNYQHQSRYYANVWKAEFLLH